MEALLIVHGANALVLTPDTILEKDDVVALGGKVEDLTARMGVVGPDVADARALSIPLDQAEILVANPDVVGRPLKDVPWIGFPVGYAIPAVLLTVVGYAAMVLS